MFENHTLKHAMELLQKNDTSEFDIIYDETNRLVYHIIYSIVDDKEKAMDLVQDTYMRILDKISLYNSNTNPKAWISMIAKNIAINAYNKDKKIIRVEETILDIPTTESPLDTIKDTTLSDLAKSILTQEEYQIVMLCVVDGYKRREVSEILDLSISGVTWKLNNALDKLKNAYEKGGTNHE